MDKTFDYGNCKVPDSPQFKVIMAKYDLVGRHLSVSKFYRDYVKPLDEKLTLRQWKWFIDKFRKHVDKKIIQSTKNVLKKSEDASISEVQLEASSMRKLLAIADMTLDEMLANPQLLADIPIKERMAWLFQTMKARDSRTTVNIKNLTETRKVNMYEDMMRGAQYGAIDADVIKDPTDLPPKQIEEAKESKPAIKIPINEETKEFVPEDIE